MIESKTLKILIPDNQIITTATTVEKISNSSSRSLAQFFNYLSYYYGCTYILYMYENLSFDHKIIYCSNWKWQNFLFGENLINECHICKAGVEGLASGKNSIVLPWNTIYCKTSLEKDIILLRSEFNIANGIGIAHTNGEIRESIGLAADINDINFYQRVMTNSLLFRIMKKTRLLAMKEIKFTKISASKLND